MTNLKRTTEIETEDFIREMYCDEHEKDEATPERIETHDGAWIKDAVLVCGQHVWRWYAAAEE